VGGPEVLAPMCPEQMESTPLEDPSLVMDLSMAIVPMTSQTIPCNVFDKNERTWYNHYLHTYEKNNESTNRLMAQMMTEYGGLSMPHLQLVPTNGGYHTTF
jgi:hypothetical protein